MAAAAALYAAPADAQPASAPENNGLPQDYGEDDIAQSSFAENGGARPADTLPTQLRDYRSLQINRLKAQIYTSDLALERCPPGRESCEAIQTERTFGGIPVLRGAAPFQAQLTEPENLVENGVPVAPSDWERRHRCGGALVAPGWVLTAAHCIDESIVDLKWRVRLGINNLAQDTGRSFLIDRVECFNPVYCRAADRPRVLYSDDIALVHFTMDEGSVIDAPEPHSFQQIGIERAWLSRNEGLLRTLSEDGLLRGWDISSGAELAREIPRSTDRFGRRDQAGTSDLLSGLHNRRGNALPPPDVMPFRGGEMELELRYSGQPGPAPRCAEGADELILRDMAGNNTEVVTCLAQVLSVRISDDENFIFSVEAVQSGSENASGTRRTVLTAWDAQTFEMMWQREDDLPREVTESPRADYRPAVLASGPDQVVFALADAVLFLDPETGAQRQRIAHWRSASWQSLNGGGPDGGARNFVDAASISADGKRLVTVTSRYGGSDAWLWDRESGQILRHFPHSDASLSERAAGARLTEDGRYLLSWSNYGTVRLWDAASGALISTMRQDLQIRSLHLVGPGLRLLAEDAVGAILWEARTGRKIHQFLHLDQALGVEVDARANRLLTWGRDATARLWDLETGEEIRRLFHSGIVNGARLIDSPDRILTWSDDGTARITPVDGSVAAMVFDVARAPAGSPLAPPSGTADQQPAAIRYLDVARGANEPATGSQVRIYGWGKTETVEGFRPYATLMEVDLGVMDNADCSRLDGMGPVRQRAEGGPGHVVQRVHPRVVCARDDFRKTCKGDSGGPVLAGGQLVGIVSWGKNTCAGDGQPGIYTRVASYADWIDRITGRPAETTGLPAN